MIRFVVIFGKILFGEDNVNHFRPMLAPVPPVPHDFHDGEGWVSRNDFYAMRAINKARAVGRAKEKLTVLEYNALALYIKRHR